MADLSSYDQRNLFGADVILSGLLGPDDLCSTIKREISPLLKDSDFEEMYKDGGRPPISPRILILTLLMQFLERLPDRAASSNLKFRLDWKIAFELPLDFAGIHPTTLVYFRNRLIASQKASLLFDSIIEHLKSCGLIKKGGKQRIDSTHIIGCVRELSRIELFHETLRLFCLDVVPYTKWMDERLITFHDRYLDKISIHGVTDEQKKEFIQSAGLSMKAFISWGGLTAHVKSVEGLDHFKTLKKVFEQNFIDQDSTSSPELIRIATGKGHISSPHETDANYANKGKKRWLGYKGQVVETVNEEGEQNFITYIDAEGSTNYDGDCVSAVIEDLQKKEIAPLELYGDTHYNSVPNIEQLQKSSIEMKGPVHPGSKIKAEKNIGFEIDLALKIVTCPMGETSKHFHKDPEGKVRASFPKKTCQDCLRKEICKPEPRGKIYEARPENQILSERRKKMEDPKYKRDLHKRNGVEGTISGLVRGQNWRRCRYRGKAKAQLQSKIIGAAANVCRLHRLRQRQQRLF